MSEYSTIIERLFGLNELNVKLGLENISGLLKHLGNPQKELKTIHIAGTNGKGSTALFLNSIFNISGYKTGLYVSPHLIDIRERITVGTRKISQKSFIELSEHIFCVMEKEDLPVTFFEFVTALAFLYFSQERVDIGIIEVGLGGRLDATNVLNPLVSIITEIGMEHTQYLGSSIKEISSEKGGIIKPGGVVFISAKNNEAIATIKNISKKERATCFQYGEDFVINKHDDYSKQTLQTPLPQIFSIEFQGRKLIKLKIKTAGIFQIKNSATATAVALYLSNKYRAINENSISEGLKKTRIPCRMELMQQSPRIVLDVAHNFQAMRALIENIPLFFTFKRLIVILGILNDKDYKKIIKILSAKSDTFIMTEPISKRALSAHLLETQASSLHKQTFIEKKVSKALKKANEIAGPHDLILVTGSFYSVGEALSELS